MNLFNNDKNILNTIKYGPILFVLIISFTITLFFMNEKQTNLKKELISIEKQFTEDNKLRIKSLVNRIYSLILIEEENAVNDLKNLVKNEVEQSYNIIKSIYNRNIKKENYSKEKTILEIKSVLREMRYLDDKGYLFIYNLNGDNILNAEFPNIEGKNLWNYKDSKGTLLIQKMNEILKTTNNTFSDWYWKKSKNDPKEYKKVGYFKKFEPYNMFIGSGAYLDDFEKLLQKRVSDKLNRLTFENFEHIFIYNLDGLCLVNPKKELVGVNRYDVKNDDGKYVVRDLINFIKEKKSDFRSYGATAILDDKLVSNEKISYLKLYEKWGWMIGSGFYLEDLYNKLENKKIELKESNEKSIKLILCISFVITIIFIIISFLISNQLKKRFISYRKKIDDEIGKKVEKEKLLIQQSKMATMGEMLSSIAHQWKQPISIISMSNGLLKLNKENKEFSNEEEIDNAMKSIDTSIKNLTQTIDDFRDFFNPNKERNEFKVLDMVDETLKLINSQFKNSNIELIKSIEDIELFGSQNELQQTLINLLKNAKEELVNKEKDKKRLIFIDSYIENDNVIIKVKDNADGIPKDIIDKVFDSYFTTKEKDGGSGIGLYICKQIVENSMRGSITVSNVKYEYENETYDGAEFIISIPIDIRDN